MLLRAREKRGGLCSGRSTATARWRRRGCFWTRRHAWHGRGLQREATGRGGGAARRVGASATEKGGREASPRRRRRCRRWAAARTEQGVEVEEKGDFAISKNSRDYSVNQR